MRYAVSSAAILAFLVVFLSCYGSILLIRSGGALAFPWPANALILVYLLRTPIQLHIRGDVLFAAVLGVHRRNAGGANFAATLWFTMANGLEVFVAYWWIRWRVQHVPGADDARSRFWRFSASVCQPHRARNRRRVAAPFSRLSGALHDSCNGSIGGPWRRLAC